MALKIKLCYNQSNVNRLFKLNEVFFIHDIDSYVSFVFVFYRN